MLGREAILGQDHAGARGERETCGDVEVRLGRAEEVRAAVEVENHDGAALRRGLEGEGADSVEPDFAIPDLPRRALG
jgi:hypothetical protein